MKGMIFLLMRTVGRSANIHF